MSYPVISKSNSGFTLIEIVTGLVISGFIAVMIGSGLVYSVQLYRSIKGIDEGFPQANVAFNIIRSEILKGNLSEEAADEENSCTRGDFSFSNGTLKWNEMTLLTNVKSCSIKEKYVFNTSASVYHVRLSLNMNDNERTFAFDVCED